MLRRGALQPLGVLGVHGDEPRRERQKILVILLLTGGGERGESPAVEPSLQRDDVVIFGALVLLPPFAGGLYRALVGFRPRIAEENLFEPGGADERFRKLSAGRGVIQIGCVRELSELGGDRRRPFLVRIAEYVDAYAAPEVEIASAVLVPHITPLAVSEHDGEAGIRPRDICLVLFLYVHMLSPDTNIVPMPSSVSVSMRME